MPEIIFLMGKSATGKDHIYEQLAHDEQLHLKRITMYTTRPMRAGEAEGVEYHFVNDDEAARLEKKEKSSKCAVMIRFTACGNILRSMTGRYS